MLGGLNEIVLFALEIAAFLGVIELGFRLGRRHADADEARKTHVGALQAAVLGLLALLLAFTFSMAVSRFDTRKALVLDEANAIGTTHLRAELLPDAQRRQTGELLAAYVKARLAFWDAGDDRARIDAANAEAARIGDLLWKVATAASAADPHAVSTGLFVQSLNDVLDLAEKRLVALDDHVPEAVLWLLLVVSLVSLGFIAFGAGLTGRRHHVSTGLFALLIALVIATIVDIDRPRRGLVTVGQGSMMRLQAALGRE